MGTGRRHPTTSSQNIFAYTLLAIMWRPFFAQKLRTLSATLFKLSSRFFSIFWRYRSSAGSTLRPRSMVSGSGCCWYAAELRRFLRCTNVNPSAASASSVWSTSLAVGAAVTSSRLAVPPGDPSPEAERESRGVECSLLSDSLDWDCGVFGASLCLGVIIFMPGLVALSTWFVFRWLGVLGPIFPRCCCWAQRMSCWVSESRKLRDASWPDSLRSLGVNRLLDVFPCDDVTGWGSCGFGSRAGWLVWDVCLWFDWALTADLRISSPCSAIPSR